MPSVRIWLQDAFALCPSALKGRVGANTDASTPSVAGVLAVHASAFLVDVVLSPFHGAMSCCAADVHATSAGAGIRI